LSQVKSKDASISEDDLYTEPVYCHRCRDECKHILIGEHREDYYIYGDNTLDERFFIYNKTIQND
jgi:hypothetical protein